VLYAYLPELMELTQGVEISRHFSRCRLRSAFPVSLALEIHGADSQPPETPACTVQWSSSLVVVLIPFWV